MTREEQVRLIRKWQEDKCTRSRDAVMLSFHKYVWYWVKSYTSLGKEDGWFRDDLFQAGCIGVLTAINKFDCDQTKARMSTYAALWIKSFMNREMATFHARFKYPKKGSVKSLLAVYGGIYRSAKQCNPRASREEIRELIALSTGNTTDVVKYVEEILTPVRSLSDPIKLGSALGFGDVVPDTAPSPEVQLMHKSEEAVENKQLRLAMEDLNIQEEYVLEKRYLDDAWTLKELGAKLNLSKQRIAQIEKKALTKRAIDTLRRGQSGRVSWREPLKKELAQK